MELDDPLCVSRVVIRCNLTGDDTTKYFGFVAKLVNPNISAKELKLISTHSVHVYAHVLLHKTGKDEPFIELRLRWLSNCFVIYLSNTNIITNQHADALKAIHAKMAALALATTNMNIIFKVNGAIGLVMDEFEDDD